MLQIVADCCIILHVVEEQTYSTSIERRNSQMIGVSDLCDYILYRAYTETKHDESANGRFTNLWLQKALYYVCGEYLAKFGKPLLAFEFEAWMYGPVYPEAYLLYRKHKRDAIPQPACPALPEISPATCTFINQVVRHYSQFPAAKLIEDTRKESPWVDASHDGTHVGVGVTISNAAMQNYFTKHALQY